MDLLCCLHIISNNDAANKMIMRWYLQPSLSIIIRFLVWEILVNEPLFRYQVYDVESGALLASYCGSGIRYIHGTSNAVRVVFTTDGSVSESGFELEWAGRFRNMLLSY